MSGESVPNRVIRDTWLLLRLDGRRISAGIRHPSAGAWLGVVLPVIVLAGLLWRAAGLASVDVAGAAGAATLAMLGAGALSQLCYGLLWRGIDAPLLRRLGVEPRAIFVERALRLLAAALLLLLLLLTPIAAAGEALARPLAIGTAAALAAWGFGAAGYAGAGLAMARREAGQGWGCLAMGMWDREVAAAAPLVWAPLAPFLAGVAAGTYVGAGYGAAWGRVLVAGGVSLLALLISGRWYASALPRFGPRALEFAFEPPPALEGGELHVHVGLARLLPRRAALARARDAVVVGRRFAWAQRVVWPVAIGSLFALARWGELPGPRRAVAAAVFLALLVQGIAAIALGRAEAAGRRWLDRSTGLGGGSRLLGRWAWGWGASLWLTIPVAFAWSWWSGAGSGWGWIAAGAGTAGIAALASTGAAGWR